MLELAFFLPFIFFCFVGVVDWGFFAYALISVQSSARVAAFYTSTSTSTATDAGGACTLVLNELQSLPNIGTSVSSCSGSVLTVTASQVAGSDGSPASAVSVSYQSLPLIPIPGVLAQQFTWTRTVTMRLRG
ncbi:MAG TPA: TadE/TadG family type IV pilus assembly protein [Bryobacteraceae bacterium]|nr:TadE/TadG family type IV pilus assembly protein [Bryobacteraceae bacterium]